jgi:hypothetical protein
MHCPACGENVVLCFIIWRFRITEVGRFPEFVLAMHSPYTMSETNSWICFNLHVSELPSVASLTKVLRRLLGATKSRPPF